jgi:hypothetical protein
MGMETVWDMWLKRSCGRLTHEVFCEYVLNGVFIRAPCVKEAISQDSSGRFYLLAHVAELRRLRTSYVENRRLQRERELGDNHHAGIFE